MSRRGARTRVEEGIFRDAIGLSAVVKVGTRQRERRYPLGTDLRVLRGWRRATRARLELDLAEPDDAPAPTTLHDDIATYLALLPEGRYRVDMADLLAHWDRALGDRARAAVTAADVHGALLAWRRDGAAPQTCNHRRRALAGLYAALGEPDDPNPAKAAAKLPVPRRAPRGLPWPVVRRILVALPDRSRPEKGKTRGTVSVTKVRAWVLATTGWPHATLTRLQPSDLHLDATPPHAIIRPRHKGRGTRARAVPLLPVAVRWLRAWLALGAAGRGPFSASSLRKSFRIAVQRARARWEAAESRAAKYHRRPVRPWPVPADVRPYDVRHAFAFRAIMATGDVFAVKELLLHEDIKTTLQYLDAAVTPSAHAAIRAMTTGKPR